MIDSTVDNVPSKEMGSHQRNFDFNEFSVEDKFWENGYEKIFIKIKIIKIILERHKVTSYKLNILIRWMVMLLKKYFNSKYSG